MSVFPKLSGPLVKDIRTGEGIAEYALGIGVAVLSVCGDISIAKGVTTLTILAGLKGVRRGLIKLVALQKGVGIGDPIPVVPAPAPAAPAAPVAAVPVGNATV